MESKESSTVILNGISGFSSDASGVLKIEINSKKSPDNVDMILHKTRWYCRRCDGCNQCRIYCGKNALRSFCLRGPKLVLTSNKIISIEHAINVIWSSELLDQETMCLSDKKWSVKTKDDHFELEHQLLFTPEDIRMQINIKE